jgi:hypothetical protein
MPIHRMLKGATFDAKAVPILLEVFDESVADLDLQTPEDRENVAKIIVGLRMAKRPSTQQSSVSKSCA